MADGRTQMEPSKWMTASNDAGAETNHDGPLGTSWRSATEDKPVFRKRL